jgi:hypothetical protein
MKIINVRGMKTNDPTVTYCGRNCSGWRKSPLHNPYKEDQKYVREDGTTVIKTVLALFEEHLLSRLAEGDPVITQALDALTEDSVLGCWCVPKKRCHCEVLVEVFRDRRRKWFWANGLKDLVRTRLDQFSDGRCVHAVEALVNDLGFPREFVAPLAETYLDDPDQIGMHLTNPETGQAIEHMHGVHDLDLLDAIARAAGADCSEVKAFGRGTRARQYVEAIRATL